MVTDVELQRLAQSVLDLAHYVPRSEHWRFKEVVSTIARVIRMVKSLEEELRVSRTRSEAR